MSKQHSVFVEDKQKAPAQPKSDTQHSPAQEGVGEGAKAVDKSDDLPPADDS